MTKTEPEPPEIVVHLRPGESGRQLQQSLCAAGYHAIGLPQVAIEALAETQEHRNVVLDLDRFDRIIVTSQYAARSFLIMVDKYWPQLPQHPQWYSIGRATGRILRQYGISVMLPNQDFTSESLLSSAEFLTSDFNYLLVKGEAGRTHLVSEITAAGGRIRELILYRRKPIEYPSKQMVEILEQPIKAVLVSSGEILLQFHKNLVQAKLTHKVPTLTVIVPSHRVYQLAESLGFVRCIQAPSASDLDMLATLKAL